MIHLDFDGAKSRETECVALQVPLRLHFIGWKDTHH
jgi:hypothetical protein